MSVCGFTSEPRRRRSAGVRSALVLLVVAVFLVAGPTAGAKRKDHAPPTFAGLKSATTCVPGPVGGGRTTSYNLTWDAATDNVSPPSTIVYLVYQASAPGAEAFSTPTYPTAAGATSFATPPLPANKPVYYVVRARDQAGNIDSITVERQGEN